MLTNNQQKFLKICEAKLGEPDFSDLTCEDVANEMNIDINVAKGILGSLCKEDILYIERTTVNNDPKDFIWISSLWRDRKHLLEDYLA